VRKINVAGVILALLAGLVFAAFCYRERRTYRCLGCSSQRNVTRWAVGYWSGFSVRLTPDRIVTRESHALRDFFPPHHRHEWAFGQGSPYYFLGTSWGG